MPTRKVAYRDTADIIKAGASPNTAGIGVQRSAIAGRTVAGGDIAKMSVDGATTFDLPFGQYMQKTIVDGSATSLFDYAVASGAMAGGIIFFTVEASDGTDLQADSGMATYSSVSKAGTITSTVTYATGNEAKAVSTGTLTLSFTNVTGTLKSTVKVQPTGSLTETTPYRITLFILPLQGGAITTL